MNLKKTAVKRVALILSLSLLSVLFACGELSTSLLSSGGTYQVKALVNGTPLENCSIIRQDDKIVPYFAVSAVNDPDLTGLLVYLKNTKGDIVGERVLYTIDSEYAALKQQEETKDNEEESKTAGQPEQQAAVDTKSAVKKYDVVIPLKSFGKEMPSFPLSTKMDIGQYSLVFESLGKSNTLSLTELDIFYLGSVEFRLNDISMYLPWLSDTRLIPPGATVMLAAGLDFNGRLNPYVIWYNGKNVISEGNISEGAGNILWKAPEQPGFYSLRLEVFPYHLKRKFTGISRDITIPVSTKASQTGYFFENGSDYTDNSDTTVTASILAKYSEPLRLYRFDGNINEASSIPDRMLEPAEKKPPRWAAVDQSYGLSIGPDDTYLLRPINFFRQGQNQGGGIFMFHIRPITEGTIFNAFFPALASSSNGVWMDMTTREDAITLRLKTKETSVEIPVSHSFSGEQGLIPIVVEFYIRPYRFEAKLILGEDFSKQSKTGGIRLPGALAGEGRIKLGVDKTAPNIAVSKNTSETGDGAEENAAIETVQPAVTTIWNEFAILYSTTPLLPEDFFAEDYNLVKTEEARPSSATAPIPAESAGTGAPRENEAANIRLEQTAVEDEEAKSLISTL